MQGSVRRGGCGFGRRNFVYDMLEGWRVVGDDDGTHGGESGHSLRPAIGLCMEMQVDNNIILHLYGL